MSSSPLISTNSRHAFGPECVILELQEQLLVAREQSRVQATQDSLTGLLNHGAILSVLEKELARSAREGTPVAVLMADIDHFKSVNDTYGHPVGDAVLRETARKIETSVRPYDSIGRYGGEEFVVVLPGCELDAAVKRAETIRELVCGQPFRVDDVSISTTMSIGVALAPDDARLDQLLRAADEALYVAKNGGRNRVAASSPVTSNSILSVPAESPKAAATLKRPIQI